MSEPGHDASALEVARHYGDFVDGIVIDSLDAPLNPQFETTGLRVTITNAIMKRRDDQRRLANTVLEFATALADTVRA